MAKERIRTDSSFCCNIHICVTDFEIQAASLFLPYTGNSYIFIVTAYCLNQIPLCRNHLCVVASQTSEPELRGQVDGVGPSSRMPVLLRAGAAAHGLQVARCRVGAQAPVYALFYDATNRI